MGLEVAGKEISANLLVVKCWQKEYKNRFCWCGWFLLDKSPRMSSLFIKPLQCICVMLAWPGLGIQEQVDASDLPVPLLS